MPRLRHETCPPVVVTGRVHAFAWRETLSRPVRRAAQEERNRRTAVRSFRREPIEHLEQCVYLFQNSNEEPSSEHRVVSRCIRSPRFPADRGLGCNSQAVGEHLPKNSDEAEPLQHGVTSDERATVSWTR